MPSNEYNDHIEINYDNAVLLLAAAQELDEPAAVVETTSTGYFRVPQRVVDKAGLGPAHRQSDKTPTDKQAAKVQEPTVLGDPMANGDPQPSSRLTPLIPQQDADEESGNAKRAEKRAEAEQKAATTETRKAPAKRAATKQATAKKAAATTEKSE